MKAPVPWFSFGPDPEAENGPFRKDSANADAAARWLRRKISPAVIDAFGV